jgi:hypothetical protein
MGGGKFEVEERGLETTRVNPFRGGCCLRLQQNQAAIDLTCRDASTFRIVLFQTP